MTQAETKDDFPILIVEDDIISRKILKKILIAQGHEVVVAENGKEALSTLSKRFFPIVITDWMMPQMNGLELCREIRGIDFPGYVYIMILTSLDSQKDIITGLQAGADDYLIKPVNEPELAARLNTGKRILELERSLRLANEEIRVLSVTDSLTKVFNRAYINENLPVEIKRSSRYGRPLSIILCDLDHFKKVNDTYGHHAGDTVLIHFAQQLKSLTREHIDWPARYGGEEFLLVMPETSVMNAAGAAERLRKSIEQSPVATERGEISITASFGVAGFDAPPTLQLSAEAFISQADNFLYQAKNEGRNRVIFGPPMEALSDFEQQVPGTFFGP